MAPGRERPVAGRQGSAARLMSALVAAGGSRLALDIDWHRPVWIGRSRPASPRISNDLRRQGYQPKQAEPGFYRFEQQKKRARRLVRASELAKG